MSKRKPVESIETQTNPAALIIGSGFTVDYIANSLKDRGCDVITCFSYSPSIHRFDYIFQFGNFPLVDLGLKNHLTQSGKFLFIETEIEENLKEKEGVKILRVGSPLLWNMSDLTEKILRTMFSHGKVSLIDVRKKMPFAERGQKQVISHLVQKPIRRPVETQMKHHYLIIKKRHFITKKRLFAVFLFFLLMTLGAAGIVYWYLLSLKYTFSQFKAHIASSDWNAVIDDIDEARQKISLGKNVYQTSSTVLFPLREVSFFKDTGRLLETSDRLLDAGNDLLTFFKQSSFSMSGFSIQESGVSRQELVTLRNKLDYFEKVVIASKQDLGEISSPFFPKDSFNSFLTLAADKLIAGREMYPLVEKLFFETEPKTYLVLFQNNMELRPTGGFIGSYGLLTVGNGKIIDFKIEDVYTADGQLKGHVDPPEPIRKYLGQPHFFLRDSNFDPDFAISAVRAAWFLEKEMGIKVDGVVGINLFFVQKLLRLFGSLKIADFGNEEINADNFFFKANFFAQTNFFPGSTKKKDFLTSVANNLMLKLTSEKKGAAWLELLPIVKQSFEEKNIILFANEESLQKFIEEKGFGGRMVEVKCVKGQDQKTMNGNNVSEKTCSSDYLAVVEANLGVNKANYFINKTIAVEKKVRESGEISSIVTISYENTGTPEVFVGANYVNYLRIFVPLGSKLTGITLNNVPLPSSEIDILSYGLDKTVFGFLVKIAPENKGIVKVAFAFPSVFSANNNSYQFFYQKQAGDKISPLVLSLTYPSSIKFKSVNFNPVSEREREVYFATDTSVDRIFAFEIPM